MKRKKITKFFIGLILSISVLSQGIVYAVEDTVEEVPVTSSGEPRSDFYYDSHDTYNEYIEAVGEQNNADNTLTIKADVYETTTSADVVVKECSGKSAVCVLEGGVLTLPVEIQKSGFYNIQLDYYPIEAGSSSIKFELLIDGELPFYEAENLSLKRTWQDSQEKEYDSQGNQIRLPSKEMPIWMSKTLTDTSGFSQEPFRFFFTEGAHTITFSVYQNTLALEQLHLTPPEKLVSYETLLSSYEERKYQDATECKRIEAEAATAKSDRSIVTVNDKTSPVTVPYSGKEIVYNSIGSGSWKTVGEWVEWNIDVPEDGLYTLVLRYKQDVKSGDVSFRTLYIDGEIPFEEAKSIAFSYDGDWQTVALGDKDNTYKFYLTEGSHTVRLEATLGKYSSMISRVSDALSNLNDIYTDIVMITGPVPDVDRDYQFEKIMPEILETMKASSDELKEIEKELEILTGETGGESTAVIRRLYRDIDEMLEDTDTISKRLNQFMSNITSLGTWINTSREQPLLLDYVMLSNEDAGVPKDKANIFSILKYYVAQFFYSFKMDYANVGNQKADVDTEITVWISAGRDQADIIRQLVNESFTPEYGIGVNVQLVDAGALMPATLAGEGPDIYLGMGQNQPVEYALRHAVVDLSKFEDISEITPRFYEDSLTAFYLDEGLYALPETMSYPMLFYRKDILTDLGIQEEDLTTWDSLLQTVLPELDMNNFDFGIPTSMNYFGNFLYQNGGSFYNEENTSSAFNTAEAIEAFETMTTLYTDYGIPVAYDFANRFRSGQMPLAIAEYTSYNQLSIFAPEIEGLWGMKPIPGVADENGNIDNTAVCSVSGAVILANSSYIEESWTFLKWWTEGEVQSRYASELETVMGTGARYASANIEAMQSVEWERGIKNALTQQQSSLRGLPSIAGGYYTARSFDFAFRDVVNNGKNLRETLSDAATSITKEIESKRNEFYGEK